MTLFGHTSNMRPIRSKDSEPHHGPSRHKLVDKTLQVIVLSSRGVVGFDLETSRAWGSHLGDTGRWQQATAKRRVGGGNRELPFKAHIIYRSRRGTRYLKLVECKRTTCYHSKLQAAPDHVSELKTRILPYF